MNNRFVWLENSASGRRREVRSGERKREVIGSKGFFGLLSNLLKLKIFYQGERQDHDTYRYN